MDKIMSALSRFVKWFIFVAAILHVAQAASIFNRDLLELSKSQTDEKSVNLGLDSSFRTLDAGQYYQARKEIMESERESCFGNDIQLNEKEKLANEIIMKAKEAELEIGLNNPNLFNPGRHIFEVFDTVKTSKLFQMIKKMPKGGILHAHETALCSADYVVSLTRWPDLWQRTSSNNEIIQFIFSRQMPKNPNDDNSTTWRRVDDVRAEMGASKYDEHVRKLFTLFDKDIDPRIQFKDVNEVWNRFTLIFAKIAPILTYVPVRKAYYKQALRELQEDGVQYLELRGTLSKLYDLDGNDYTEKDVLNIYLDVLDEFKRENPLFIGSKLVYAPPKPVSNETIARYFETVRQLHSNYSNFLVGFDLVGQEDTAPVLLSFAQQILQLPSDLKFFFHAGETKWFGSVDENLIDAVLLGSRRIGHGYALAKHPKLIDLVKSNNIAVEVNPISNQVLKLVDDYRNHPASIFLAQNIPVVISSDDPSFWEVSPLTHDFYMTFLGIASSRSDLRTLKKLAFNSIEYSSLTGYDKMEAIIKLQTKWDTFIDDLLHSE